MILSLFMAACVAAEAPGGSSDSLVSLYQRGRTFPEFLAAATNRKDTWERNAGRRSFEPTLIQRARALDRTWRILVVAEDWCGDSANTIPYLGTFADSAGGKLEIRIINSVDGRWVMERYRTGDGRAATPTVVILDEQGEAAGCWVERPSELAGWMREQRGKLSQDELLKQKYAWYDDDQGQSTLREILDLIEHPRSEGCGGNAAEGKP